MNIISEYIKKTMTGLFDDQTLEYFCSHQTKNEINYKTSITDPNARTTKYTIFYHCLTCYGLEGELSSPSVSKDSLLFVKPAIEVCFEAEFASV